MFSFVPRCQGLRGSAKYTARPVAAVTSLWPASSIPRSQVSVRRTSTGSWATIAVPLMMAVTVPPCRWSGSGIRAMISSPTMIGAGRPGRCPVGWGGGVRFGLAHGMAPLVVLQPGGGRWLVVLEREGGDGAQPVNGWAREQGDRPAEPLGQAEQQPQGLLPQPDPRA